MMNVAKARRRDDEVDKTKAGTSWRDVKIPKADRLTQETRFAKEVEKKA